MRIILTIIICVIELGLFSQDHVDIVNKNKNYISEKEAELLTQVFTEIDAFDFNNKKIAFVAGASGNILLDKTEFFEDYIEPVIQGDKKNVCKLIILTEIEIEESGGYDAIILTPAKIFKETHKQELLKELRKTAR